MTNDVIRKYILSIIDKYSIKKVTLFGSRANETNRDDSDVDLIMEFFVPVSVLTLSKIRCELEEIMGINIDIIHGPLRDDDMIEIGKVVELYAA